MKTSQKNKYNSATKKEVERILKNNTCKCQNKKTCECNGLSEDSSIFVGKFLFNLLKEADDLEDEKTPEDFNPETNKQDFNDALEPETSDKQFDVEGVNPAVTSQNIESVKGWSKKLEEFNLFLNNPDSQNLHRILADSDRPGTLLRGITRKTSDSITRIAGEIAKLQETLNSYINMAPKKIRDSEQLRTS